MASNAPVARHVPSGDICMQEMTRIRESWFWFFTCAATFLAYPDSDEARGSHRQTCPSS